MGTMKVRELSMPKKFVRTSSIFFISSHLIIVSFVLRGKKKGWILEIFKYRLGLFVTRYTRDGHMLANQIANILAKMLFYIISYLFHVSVTVKFN